MSTTRSSPPRITVVESPACHLCHDARQALNEIAQDHPFTLETLDSRSAHGSALMQTHGAAMSPLVLLDGAYVSAGRLPRGKLRKLLAARVEAPS